MPTLERRLKREWGVFFFINSNSLEIFHGSVLGRLVCVVMFAWARKVHDGILRLEWDLRNVHGGKEESRIIYHVMKDE